ncbi:MAG: hypothetical protein KGL35_04735, partial [Bradyrhizobium sp.]|nr:hypothetical protein [Bradyrhizobium sp.]
KVEQGVYTGFSQGGRYVKRWKDPENDTLMRYTAEPLEVSLVDSPCLPDATFSVIKADGSTELRKFAKVDPATRAEGKAAAHRDAAKEHDEAAKKSTTGSAEEKAHRAAHDEHQKAADLHSAAAAQHKAGDGDTANRLSAEADKQSDVAEAASKDAASKDAASKAASAADGEWEQVWVSKRLPGQEFKTKAALRQALMSFDAEEAAKKTAAPVLDALGAIKDKLSKGSEEISDANIETVKKFMAANVGHELTARARAVFEKGDPKETPELRKELLEIIAAMDATIAMPPAVAKADYSDDERKDMASNGEAMKDGSYPIKNRKDLENAVQAFGRAKNKAATKRHIIKRAKALKATDLLPADWPGSTKDAESKKLAGDGALSKAASADYASFLLQLLGMLERAEDGAEAPAIWDGIDVPKELQDKFGAGLSAIADVVAEIVDLVVSAIKQEEADEAVANAARAFSLLKLAKRGARHSAADKGRIKEAHDLLVDLDPDSCPGGDAEGDGAEKMIKALQGERDADRKAYEKTLGEIMTLVKTIAEQPLPMGTSSVTLRVVDKAADGGATSGSTERLNELADRALAEARAGKSAA